RDADVSQRVVRIFGDGPLEVVQSLPFAFRISFAPPIAAPQISVVRFGIDSVGLGQQGALFGSELDTDFLGDVPGDFTLQGKNVLQVALIALGPQVSVTARFDQLRGDAHSVARAQDR